MARVIAFAAALCALLWLPAGAFAQPGAALPSDPEADSPSGTVYELPLDRARGDAAPRAPRRGGSGGRPRQRGGRTTPSAIRSENGFGSSSQVPGQAGAGASPGGRGTASGARQKGQSSARSGGGGGASGGPLGDSAGAGTAGVPEAASALGADGPSGGLILALLVLLLAVGALVGAAAGRARHRRTDA